MGTFKILTNFGLFKSVLATLKSYREVPNQQNTSEKRERQRTMRDLFFILLPALAGICPHYSPRLHRLRLYTTLHLKLKQVLKVNSLLEAFFEELKPRRC